MNERESFVQILLSEAEKAGVEVTPKFRLEIEDAADFYARTVKSLEAFEKTMNALPDGGKAAAERIEKRFELAAKANSGAAVSGVSGR